MRNIKATTYACFLGVFSSAALIACAEEAVTPSPGLSSGGSGHGTLTGGSAGSLTTGGAAGAFSGTGGAATGGTSGGSSNTSTTGGAPTGGAGGVSSATGGAGLGAAGASAGSGATAGGAISGGAGGVSAGGAGGGATPGGAAGKAGAGGSAGKAGSGGTAGAPGGAGASGGPTLPPITNYTDKGSFATTMQRNVGPGSAYTVYRPEPLGQNGFLHAPIIFGPGIGQQVTVHNTMLTNFASHGFVVVGVNVLSGGPGDAGNRKAMQDGLTWIVQQNSAQGIYLGKLYVDHAVSMGFSVGGTSAVEIGGDPAVATVVSIHGHKATAALHGPMLQTTGTGDTVGMPLQQQTYSTSQVQTFLATLTGAPHAYIESNGGGDERPAIVAWMRYWIYSDSNARRYFYGDDCVLCVAPWQNPQRKNWQ